MPADERIQIAKATWSAGHWDEVADLINTVGPKLIDKVGVEEGMEVLDVGAGSGGNISIPAAKLGANVTASDLVGEHFEDGRRRAAEAGVELNWVEANAEELPFEDASFDRVFSTFGHMFAPRHKLAAQELARVLRPGGAIATATWLLDSPISAFFATMGPYLPPPPPDFQPPPLWGDQEHVREMFDGTGVELEFDTDVNVFAADTVDEYMEFNEENLGPMVMAKAALGDRWPELRDEIRSVFERYNETDDGSVRMPSGYLITVARKG